MIEAKVAVVTIRPDFINFLLKIDLENCTAARFLLKSTDSLTICALGGYKSAVVICTNYLTFSG